VIRNIGGNSQKHEPYHHLFDRKFHKKSIQTTNGKEKRYALRNGNKKIALQAISTKLHLGQFTRIKTRQIKRALID
jgi:hypothetical protein